MPFLTGGVDLFFVLSGFLISGILLDAKHGDRSQYYFAFWTRRAARILPVLYVLLVAYVFALRFDGPALNAWLLMPPRFSIWTYATFTQSVPMALYGGDGSFGGPQWLRPTWSLAVEEQFYLLFPFLIYNISRRRLALVMLCTIIAAIILRGMVYVEWGRFAAYVLLPCRMDALALGVLVQIIVRNPDALSFAKRWRGVLDGLICASVAVLLFAVWPFRSFPLHFFVLSGTFALMILRVFLYEAGGYRWLLRSRFLTAAGLISYSLYMYHQPVSGLLHALIFGREPRITSGVEAAVSVLAIALGAALASASYVLMERPIRRFAQQIISRRALRISVGYKTM